MELRETEALGVLYYHDRGVGDVDSNLYHCGGDHDLRLAADELLHLVILLGGFELTVHAYHFVMRVLFAHVFEVFFKALEVEFVVLVHEGIYHIYLPSLSELRSY